MFYNAAIYDTVDRLAYYQERKMELMRGEGIQENKTLEYGQGELTPRGLSKLLENALSFQLLDECIEIVIRKSENEIKEELEKELADIYYAIECTIRELKKSAARKEEYKLQIETLLQKRNLEQLK